MLSDYIAIVVALLVIVLAVLALRSRRWRRYAAVALCVGIVVGCALCADLSRNYVAGLITLPGLFFDLFLAAMSGIPTGPHGPGFGDWRDYAGYFVGSWICWTIPACVIVELINALRGKKATKSREHAGANRRGGGRSA